MTTPNTFEDFLKAIEKALVKKGFSAEQAAWIMQQDGLKQLATLGMSIRNSPAKVAEALIGGMASQWVTHNMKR